MLQKNLGFAQGLALYLAAVLGTGILIIPLLAWLEGGPASLIAWVLLAFLGLALSWTFATAGSQIPDAGGIQALIGRVFGSRMESLSRYLVFFCVPAGAVPASYIFAYHVCAAFLLPETWIIYFAFGCWILVAAANYAGLRLSATAQLFLSGLLVALLSFFVIVTLPSVQKENFHPFFPHGGRGVVNAGLIIFWSFLGWEAIAHLAEEFRDPKKDMVRAAIAAAVIVGVFYFAIAVSLIGVGIFKTHGGNNAPLVQMAYNVFGWQGRVFTGVLAAVICLGTMNAYMAGLSRLAYAMARAGDLPSFLAKLDPESGTPRNAVLFLLTLNFAALFVQIFFHLPLRTFFLMQNVAFLVLYTLGCLSAAWLLRTNVRAAVAALLASLVCAAMLPFAGGVLLYPAAITTIALLSMLLKKRKQA